MLNSIDERLKKLKSEMEKLSVDAYLCVNIENSNHPEAFYFSGFSGSFSILIIDKDRKLILTDSRYYEQVKLETQFTLVKFEGKESGEKKLFEILGDYKRIGLNFSRINLKFYENLKKNLKGAEFVDFDEIISKLRMIKYGDEIEKIKNAIQITQRAFENSLNFLKAGMTENEFAARLEYEMKLLGAERTAFETIVASGFRGALPHGRASDKIIEEGDLVVIDFGAVYKGYCGDITRTVAVGDIDDEKYEVYKTVERAQREAIKKMRAGMTGKEIDKIARDIINNAGYGSNFGHSLGHGIGIEVHEAPSVSPSNDTTLPSGVVVTVEPGIYLPGKFGVRIEDNVILTENGAVLLSKPNELIKV
ncbi:MAG: Xaa-Pro aminopeptidase [Thermotogaceae bacterium]|jgi:Xaa-Pro aminopeptidase|nr:Xaa-Pro aminopeptidase [Thermotogaceae bacterium]MDN5337584.1 Xaa-Pro aminopeptidase [Thermotogaceae bacterium]